MFVFEFKVFELNFYHIFYLTLFYLQKMLFPAMTIVLQNQLAEVITIENFVSAQSIADIYTLNQFYGKNVN